MKVAVFGANGRTGRELVRESLKREFEVIGFDINFDGFPFEDVETVEGDVKELEDVQKAVEDVDAVLSGLGVTPNTPSDVVSEGVNNISKVMQEEGIDRLVVLTGAGAKLKGEKAGLSDLILNLMANAVMPGVIEDGRKMVREIQESDLNWTVVRAPRLTEEPGTGEYELNHSGVHLLDTVSRADVAEFMVRAVSEELEVRQMPYIRNM